MEKLKPEDYMHLYLGQRCIRSSHHEPQNESYVLSSYNLPEAIEFADRLILRPLEEVTDEEWNIVAYGMDTVIGVFTGKDLKLSFLRGAPGDRPGWQWVNTALIRLRGLGVDMDGLIEAGLAVTKI